MRIWKICLALSSLAICCESSRILITTVFPGKSHWLMFEHIIRELLSRGHEVTAITNYQLSSRYENYTEILIEPVYDMEEFLPMSTLFKNPGYSNIFTKINTLWWLGYDTSEHALKTENVQKFIHNKNLKFDLILAEQFFQESFLMLAHQFQAPIVVISTLGYFDFMDRFMGMLTPWSYVSHYFLGYKDSMGFTQRGVNLFVSLFDVVGRNLHYLPQQERIANEYFQHIPDKPSLSDLEKSVSLMLVNNHRTLSSPRPKMEGMIDIAGVHIRPPKKLPDNLQKFMDGAKDGVIYFSFGTFMRSTEMPEKTLQVFLNVFRRLKQRVLWKWEDDHIPNLPSNVLVQKWMPQNDILAHRNTKLFLTHGGLFSSQETIARKIPMIFFPFYGDQFGNAAQFQEAGVGLTLSIITLTEEALEGAIHSILTNDTFYRRIDEMSRRFLDNPVEPLQEAIYWIEYVIRYNGAPHLKSAAVLMPWYQHLLLDVLAAILLFIAALYFLLTRACKLICSSRMKASQKKEKIK